jgi:hypothetical protein
MRNKPQECRRKLPERNDIVNSIFLGLAGACFPYDTIEKGKTPSANCGPSNDGWWIPARVGCLRIIGAYTME